VESPDGCSQFRLSEGVHEDEILSRCQISRKELEKVMTPEERAELFIV
jgi:hypothetical protein